MTNQEINEAVARKLGHKLGHVSALGINVIRTADTGYADFDIDRIPNYCEDIAAAWEIVEHLKDWHFNMNSFGFMDLKTGQPIKKFEVSFAKPLPEPHGYQSRLTDPAMAICEAFLSIP